MYKMSSKPLISAKEIEERLDSLAAEIKPCGFDVVVPLLSGSFIFAADLCRRIASPELQVSFIRASSYGNSTQSSGQLQISGLEKLDIKGKKILLVDDILDTGITLSKVCETLKACGPSEIRTCVYSPRTCIWTRQRRIFTSTLCRSQPGAIEVWKHEFR